MNLPPLDLYELMRRHGLRPDKSLGQNFLRDSAALEEIVKAAEIKPDDSVLEIGAGLGSLTRFRVCAAPGDMSLLTLSVQVYGKPVIAAKIPAEAFTPAPKVDSAVVRVDLYPEPVIPMPLLDRFFRLAKAGFSQKRKTLRNSLSAGLAISTSQAAQILEQAGIDPQRRAETLSLAEWGKLSQL